MASRKHEVTEKFKLYHGGRDAMFLHAVFIQNRSRKKFFRHFGFDQNVSASKTSVSQST